MSLEKGIRHGKEHRKPYYKSARYDKTCRPNGSCPYCKNNRYHKHNKKRVSYVQEIKELEE